MTNTNQNIEKKSIKTCDHKEVTVISQNAGCSSCVATLVRAQVPASVHMEDTVRLCLKKFYVSTKNIERKSIKTCDHKKVTVISQNAGCSSCVATLVRTQVPVKSIPAESVGEDELHMQKRI